MIDLHFSWFMIVPCALAIRIRFSAKICTLFSRSLNMFLDHSLGVLSFFILSFHTIFIFPTKCLQMTLLYAHFFAMFLHWIWCGAPCLRSSCVLWIHHQDSDASIRKRALELVYLLVNESNVKPLAKELIEYLEVSDQEFKGDLTSKICSIVEK